MISLSWVQQPVGEAMRTYGPFLADDEDSITPYPGGMGGINPPLAVGCSPGLCVPLLRESKERE